MRNYTITLTDEQYMNLQIYVKEAIKNYEKLVETMVCEEPLEFFKNEITIAKEILEKLKNNKIETRGWKTLFWRSYVRNNP